MRNQDRLTFRLRCQDNCSEEVDEYIVHPCYDGIKLQYNKESDKAYYSTKVSGEFVFMGDEYRLIQERSLLTKFTLTIYDRGEELVSGTFRKTDCKTDVDHGTITTSINANDIYDELESNNSEYNMVKWGLQKHTLNVLVKPAMQIYEVGGINIHVMSNINSYYKGSVSAEVDDTSILRDTYKFGITHNIAINIADENNVGYGGTYFIGNLFSSNSNFSATNGNGWWIKFIRDTNGYVSEDSYMVRLDNGNESYTSSYRLWGNGIPYESEESWSGIWNANEIYFSKTYLLSCRSINFYAYPSISPAVQSACRVMSTASRIVTDKHVSSADTMPSEDIYDTTHKYSIKTNVTIYVSTELSYTDNGYKMYGNLWYAPPSGASNPRPIFTDSWFNGVSVWMCGEYMNQGSINAYSVTAQIRDWYTLGDVIKGLIGQIDDTLVFESDTDHSQFLFADTNPVSGEEQWPIYLLQKSNLLEYNYEYPAWSALITWNRMKTMLRNLFNCYYDIYVDADGDRHLRIEHYNFYNNGLSYDENPRTSVDLRKVIDTRNGKPMSFLTNNWSYDTDRPYSRLEFAWMDTQSEPFAAYPIQVPKRYMIYSRNTIDDRTIDWFSADIDFMLTVNGEASSDGFVIAMSDGDGYIHQGEVDIADVTYYCQNDRMALGYLQERFLLADIYSNYVTMDNTEDLVEVPEEGRKKMRLQSVEFMLPGGVLSSPQYLYITEVGAGTIESMEVDITNMKIEATIRQDTEEL